jgi:hypothetical protein
MALFSRRHYEYMADELRARSHELTPSTLAAIKIVLANIFGSDNPAFDMELFFRNCNERSEVDVEE